MVKNWKSCTLFGYGLVLLLSLLDTYTLFASSQLVKTGINVPASQCLLYYVLLLLVNGGIMLYRREPLQIQGKWYYYFMLALVHILVNNFTFEAVRHTSLTSIMLLDHWTLTCSLLLSGLFFNKKKYGLQILNKKYGLQILLGLAISVASYATVFISDLHSVHGIYSSAIDLLIGDMLVIVGATFSVFSVVIQDFISKKDDWVKRRAFLGIFGAILTVLQIAISEWNEFRFILSSPMTAFLVISFSLSRYFICLGTHFTFQINGSTMLNMFVLIIYNIWVILIHIFTFHEKVDWIYFVAFVAAILGLLLTIFPGRMLK